MDIVTPLRDTGHGFYIKTKPSYDGKSQTNHHASVEPESDVENDSDGYVRAENPLHVTMTSQVEPESDVKEEHGNSDQWLRGFEG